jgi:hypothetical protein
MRFGLAAAALAAVVLATPAAAQNDAVDVVRGAMERLVANAGEAQDYTLTLRSGTLRTDVYVYLDGSGWEVAVPDDDPLGDMLGALVLWPLLHSRGADILQGSELSPDQAARIGRALGLRRETVDGRPADVLVVRPGELMDEPDGEMPDSLRMFVDPDTRQILRVHVAGSAEAMGEIAPGGGTMQATLDFADYRETDGLTVPHTLRMAVEVEMELGDEERAGMAAGLEAGRAQMALLDSPREAQVNAMAGLFIGLLTTGRMELPVTVENVRVNAGPPAWFQD